MSYRDYLRAQRLHADRKMRIVSRFQSAQRQLDRVFRECGLPIPERDPERILNP